MPDAGRMGCGIIIGWNRLLAGWCTCKRQTNLSFSFSTFSFVYIGIVFQLLFRLFLFYKLEFDLFVDFIPVKEFFNNIVSEMTYGVLSGTLNPAIVVCFCI